MWHMVGAVYSGSMRALLNAEALVVLDVCNDDGGPRVHVKAAGARPL